MVSLGTATAFFPASLLLGIAPGPGSVFVLTQLALHGRKAGVLVTLGLCTGLCGHAAAVAPGVAALLQTSVVAFTGTKIAGAVYLLYLAWQAFRASACEIAIEGANRLTGGQLYLRGIIMNVTNPKVFVFFLAFLPQFVTRGEGSAVVQVFLLGSMFVALAVKLVTSDFSPAGRALAWQ